MVFYDISRDILTTPPYGEDPAPIVQNLQSLEDGDACNVSQFTMCVHNATHIDAPKHFDDDGATVGELRLSHFYGKCTVVTISGILTGEDMEKLLPHCRKRIILHGNGNAYLSSSAAQVIAESSLILIGTDAVSIAPPFDEMRPHLELARAGKIVLENLNLEGVKDGEYILSAFPLKLSELEAAPCRAVLIDEGKGL